MSRQEATPDRLVQITDITSHLNQPDDVVILELAFRPSLLNEFPMANAPIQEVSEAFLIVVADNGSLLVKKSVNLAIVDRLLWRRRRLSVAAT